MIDETLETLISLGPVVSILISIIVYLYKKLTKTEEDITKLNDYIRESDKSNIIILDKITHTLDKIGDKEENNTSKVLSELRALRDAIIIRLENGK